MTDALKKPVNQHIPEFATSDSLNPKNAILLRHKKIHIEYLFQNISFNHSE